MSPEACTKRGMYQKIKVALKGWRVAKLRVGEVGDL